MLSNVKFTVTDGGLGRTAPSEDGITGYPTFNDNIADLTVFSATNRVVAFNTLAEVEATGITADSANFKQEHYFADEFYRNGGGVLYIGVFPSTDSISDGIDAINAFSGGLIRIYGVFGEAAFAEAEINVLQTKMQELVDLKKPAVAIYTGDTGAITFSTLPDLRSLTSEAPYVSGVIGQDTENYPSTITGSLGNIGAVCGALSSTDVATNILHVDQFNYASSGKMNIPGFVVNDGTSDNVTYPVTDPTITEALLSSLDGKGYIFWRYLANVAGTYLSNDHTASGITSDFYAIHNTRVLGKVIRLVDTALSPAIGGKILVNADGTIRRSSISSLTNSINEVLAPMELDTELSGWSIFIDPKQKPLATATIYVEIAILPVGSSDYINVSLGFTSNL